MKPETVAILAAAVTGILTLAGVWISALASSRRERVSFRRTSTRERLDALSAMFEQALMLLERHARHVGYSSEADTSEMLQLKARLTLRASADVVSQFEQAAQALDAWATEARQGSPRPASGGITIFSAGMGEKKHNEAAQQLWPASVKERERLIAIMRRELEHYEKSLK